MMPQSNVVPIQSGESSEMKRKRNINITYLYYKLSFMCVSCYEDSFDERFTNEELIVINEMKYYPLIFIISQARACFHRYMDTIQ